MALFTDFWVYLGCGSVIEMAVVVLLVVMTMTPIDTQTQCFPRITTLHPPVYESMPRHKAPMFGIDSLQAARRLETAESRPVSSRSSLPQWQLADYQRNAPPGLGPSLAGACHPKTLARPILIAATGLRLWWTTGGLDKLTEETGPGN